jgi:hypothetical protein
MQLILWGFIKYTPIVAVTSMKVFTLTKIFEAFKPGVANPRPKKYSTAQTRIENQWFFDILDDFPLFSLKCGPNIECDIKIKICSGFSRVDAGQNIKNGFFSSKSLYLTVNLTVIKWKFCKFSCEYHNGALPSQGIRRFPHRKCL